MKNCCHLINVACLFGNIVSSGYGIVHTHNEQAKGRLLNMNVIWISNKHELLQFLRHLLFRNRWYLCRILSLIIFVYSVGGNKKNRTALSWNHIIFSNESRLSFGSVTIMFVYGSLLFHTLTCFCCRMAQLV